MLITFEKAVEILSKGKDTTLITSDGKVAIVPKDKAGLKISSMEAINLMFYVIRAASPEETAEAILVKLQPAVAEAIEVASRPTPDQIRQKKYREIRGDE
jgi:hypothetical protein